MRADQLEKLRQIQEEIADLFIGECDTKGWPGLDTKDGRGDRYWLKKNATASLVLVGRIENLLALRDGRSTGERPNPEDEAKRKDEAHLDGEIAEAEKEAARLGRKVVDIRGARKKG